MRSGVRLLLILSLLLGGGLASVTSDASPTPGSVARLRVGDKAPAFALKTADNGEKRSFDDLARGSEIRGVVLVFLSCRCPYVAQARAPLSELSKRYGGRIAFVGINANHNESADDVKADAAARFSFPVLRDEAAKVADLYAAERTPEVFLIDARADAKGVIRYHGGVADLDAALDAFVAGREIAKPEAKAFGCTIKRKT